jgi:hypothetical protein
MYSPQPQIICNCGNQLLVAPGCACDVCMGIASDPSESQWTASPERKDQYDMSYFEALERLFESFEYAA